MGKINPFAQSNPGADPKLVEMLKAKFKEYKKGSDWSDDLWAAYQSLLVDDPKSAGPLYQAWVVVSEEMILKHPYDVLGLSEYDDIYFQAETNAWWGVKDDKPERLPETFQDYKDIWWEGERNAYVGTKEEGVRHNPAPKSVLYDAGKNAWFNIFTGVENV